MESSKCKEMTSLHAVLMYICSIFNQFQGSINSKQAIKLRGISIEDSEYHYTVSVAIKRTGAVLGVLNLSRAGGSRQAVTQRNETVRLQRLQEDIRPRRQSGATHERPLSGTTPSGRMFSMYFTI